MRKNKILKIILHTYLNQGLEIGVVFYNLLAFFGISTGIIVALIAAFSKFSVIIIIINLMVSLLSYIMLRVAEKKKCYRICSWIWIVLIFMIAFPALFFYCGGHKSGTSCFFILAILFTALLLEREKHERVIAIAVEFILYTACSVIFYSIPNMAVILPSDLNYILHSIFNFATCSVVLLATVLIRNSIIHTRQIQIQELNYELEEKNKTLARYDQMKSDFLATVAHELNTPLAVISISNSDTLDLLKESVINMDEIIENQKIIEKRVKLIDNILLDLMDTVAIEKGKISLTCQPVNLAEFLKNICGIQFKRLNSNANQIIYDLQSDLPEIWIDQLRMEQVIINLLSNSIHYTKNGIITIKLTRTDKKQIVSVIDNGEGMDAETVREALKQYVSTKADYWRHGIGLYICRRIIEAHRGDIWINSEKGCGTAVSFSVNEGDFNDE